LSKTSCLNYVSCTESLKKNYQYLLEQVQKHENGKNGLIHECGLFIDFKPDKPIATRPITRKTPRSLASYFGRFRKDLIEMSKDKSELVSFEESNNMLVQDIEIKESTGEIFGTVDIEQVRIIVGGAPNIYCGIKECACTCTRSNILSVTIPLQVSSQICNHVIALLLHVNSLWRSELTLQDLNMHKCKEYTDNSHNIAGQGKNHTFGFIGEIGFDDEKFALLCTEEFGFQLEGNGCLSHCEWRTFFMSAERILLPCIKQNRDNAAWILGLFRMIAIIYYYSEEDLKPYHNVVFVFATLLYFHAILARFGHSGMNHYLFDIAIEAPWQLFEFSGPRTSTERGEQQNGIAKNFLQTQTNRKKLEGMFLFIIN
jgi:hypothetical protein